MSASLPHDWQIVYPDDVVSEERAIVSGPFGSSIGKRFFVESGIPVIRGNNLTLGEKRFVDDGFVFLTEEKAKQFKNCQAVTGDIVFTAAGTLGQVGLIPQQTNYPVYIISNKQLRLRPDPNIALSEYLYYWFSSKGVRNYIIGLNTGASVPLITLGKLRSVPINLPPIPTQRKIAGILSAYDDLIENNTRRIKILEEMTQAIYREWFVDFRFPGHEKVKLVKSELGMIPEGWEVKSILKVPQIRFIKEKVKSYKGKKRYFATADVNGIDIVGEGIEYVYANKPSRAQKQPLVNSVWFARMKDTYKVLPFTCANEHLANNCILSSGFVGLEAISPGWFGFLFFTINSPEFHKIKDLYCTGATQVSLNNDGLGRIQILVPNNEIVIKYSQFAETIVDQILTLQKKNANLRQTRDLLLPKLISGKLDVSELDIETGVENN